MEEAWIFEMKLDDRNLRLLHLLQGDPRMRISVLAKKLGMSAPATRERLQRLEEAGVISGYRLDLSPRALGYGVSAYLRIRPTPGRLAKIAELAEALPQITECHRITGEDCFILKVHVRELDDLERVIDRFLQYGQTTTSIVQSSPVPGRALPLPR